MIASAVTGKIEQYIDDVLSEKIVSCNLLRCAVSRFVRDLERQSTQDFPYHYSQAKAEAVCDFFPLILRHSIGDFAGLPFELEPWQMFAIANIFGWKRDCDDTRRFRKIYWSMGRKNGKSTIAAGIAIFLASMDINPTTGKPEDVAEVILSATKKEQAAAVIYAEIERMRLRSSHIEKLSTTINKQVRFLHNSGSIRCVGSDRPYDGLNPHAVIKDELHEWREHHRKFYDTMETGSGNRSQPLLVTVTTAGDDNSYLWKDEYTYSRGVLDGTITDESFFAYVFELDETDDPLDSKVWGKANPNFGVSLKRDYIAAQAKAAKESSLALNRFIRYHGNRLVTSTEKPFDMAQWDNCTGELSDWRTADAVGVGVDLGARDDLAAIGFVARFPHAEDEDGNTVWRYEAKTKCYIAETTQRDLTKQPFAGWKYSGLLSVCKWPTIELFGALVEGVADYGAWTVAYDPYNGQKISEDLEKEGIKAVRMAQNCIMFNEPIQDMQAAIREGRFTHDGNPLLRWCVDNAAISRDRADRWMYDKKSSSEKIDAVVALTMAFRMAMLAPARATGSLFIT